MKIKSPKTSETSSQNSIQSLKAILDPQQISEDPQDIAQYGKDWLKQWKSQALAVLFPKKTQDIIRIVQWAREHKCSLVPSGGRTGLSGGAVAIKKEFVVSFDKMNRILDFNPFEQTVCVESGCVTQKIQDFAREKGLFFPISFASEGSSQIGGNIATNVGGVHVIRYGNMRNRVLGIEVVTGRGELLKLGRGLIKNAVGYSLKDLFIGSEGLLGFITKAVLSLIPAPESSFVFLVVLDKPEDLLALFQKFKEKTQPLAFEFWTETALKHVLSHGMNYPLSQRGLFYTLIEVEKKDREKALFIFEQALEKGIIKDGTLSQNPTQSKELWKLRESISESISSFCPYKNDISVRLSQLLDFLKDLEKLLNKKYPDFEVVLFGHLGDGNLHINILQPKNLSHENFLNQCEQVNDFLFELVGKYQGSISAEHGVGLLKKPYLKYSRSSEEITIMKEIKKVFDPDNILNPGKMFDL